MQVALLSNYTDMVLDADEPRSVNAGKPRRWGVQTAPTAEPVSVDQVRLWMAQSETDVTIAGIDEHIIRHVMIPAARRMVEAHLGQTLLKTTWDAYFDDADIQDVLWLGRGPIGAVSDGSGNVISSIVSTADDGTTTTQTSTTYYYLGGLRASVALHDGSSWPTDGRDYDSLRVRYVAGYGQTAVGTPNYDATGANGTGNNALATSGTFCGTDSRTYRVQLDGASTFKYSTSAGVTWRDTTTTITGDYQLLDSGLYVKFPATSGYTAGHYWTIACTGHGVPERYCTAIKMLAAYMYHARLGSGREEVNELLETGQLPSAVRMLLDYERRVRV